MSILAASEHIRVLGITLPPIFPGKNLITGGLLRISRLWDWPLSGSASCAFIFPLLSGYQLGEAIPLLGGELYVSLNQYIERNLQEFSLDNVQMGALSEGEQRILKRIGAFRGAFGEVGTSSFGAVAQVSCSGINLLGNRWVQCSYWLGNDCATGQRIDGSVNSSRFGGRAGRAELKEVVSSFLCKRLVESCALFRESVFP
jgi:hypothetical protein